MARFYGRLQYAIDDKGRIVVPAPMRSGGPEKSLETFVLVGGLDDCVYLYAEEDFESEFGERLADMSIGDDEQRAFVRAYLWDASKVTVDAQGRISIPLSLRDRAGLGKEATLLGQGRRIEIWASERLEAATKDVRPNVRPLYNKLLGAGARK